MATRVKFTVVGTDEEQTAAEWLQAADDDVLGCRGQGHRFPKLRRSRSGIRGINVVPTERRGVSLIESTCPDCKTVRMEMTLPTGLVPDPHRYRYRYPFYGPGDARNYRPPKGVKVSRRMAFDTTWERVADDIRAASAAG